MRYLSIDPSINRIGWALFDTAAGDFNQLTNWNFGQLCPPRAGTLSVKLAGIKAHFSQASADHLVCEMPSFFNSERGRIAAREGDMNKLTLVIGTIYGCVPGAELFLYTPQTWKGSVPKEITRKRFLRAFGDSGSYKLNHDIVDAIMLLRYHRRDETEAHARPQQPTKKEDSGGTPPGALT